MSASKNIEFSVNGKAVSLPPLPGEMLSSLLRERLNLTGTKIGCNEAECGACTVILDGEPVLSCTYPAVKAHGKTVYTIEGLAESTNGSIKLHPLQEAFVKHGAVQCGFCIPGQIMTSYALLQKNPSPSSQDIKHALKDTLCRCAGYPSIINAVQAAAKAVQSGGPVDGPHISASARPMKAVGNLKPRADGVAKVTGSAIFTDDLKFEDMLHARVKRAMLASAVVKNIDTSKAKALPGVRAVLTAEDIPGEHNHGLVIPDWPTMVGVNEQIRYVGDVVAIVAADTREIASEALDLIEVDYEKLPVVTDPVQAKEPGAPLVHQSGNMLKHIKVQKGNVEEGFSAADVILEHTYFTPMHDHAFLEPECSITRLTPAGRIEIYVGSQIPYSDRSSVAKALAVPEDQVHVIGQLMGGGFGGKEDIAGQIHAALLTKATGKPVKLLYDRHESLIAHPKRHATQVRVKIGAKKDGTFIAVETELFGDTGAYASLGEKVMTRATTHSSGPYEAPHVKADCYAMYTNNPPAGAFRGFGVMQSAFAVESLVDALAKTLNMDPVELRKMNALKVGSVTNTGQTLTHSVGLTECIDKVDQEMRRLAGGGDPFTPKPIVDSPHLIRAWGFAVGYKNTGLGGGAPDKAGAEVELYRDGTVEVRTSSAELGQGLPTVLQLIAAEELGVDPDRVHILLSDTDLTPDGGPTTASRQTYVTGNAVRHATKSLMHLMTSELAEHYDVPLESVEFIEGLAQVQDRRVPFGEVADLIISHGRMPKVEYTYWAPATKPLGQGGDMHFAFSFAAQAAEIEVNTLTGEVKVLRLISANDVGYAINPLGLQGQVEGGAIMGIGQALSEDFLLQDGIVISDRLARYRTPSITFTPEITTFFIEHPTEDGPYGAKGVGEIVLIPTVPAITNAIYNAIGVRVDRIPVDQEHVLRLMGEKRRAMVSA
jgi:CO/xanthine dehydrogenase Mo-binding subunit/aerobic-type carbon monoxide dehydrogenase small subunit (CoxS/CutS family)